MSKIKNLPVNARPREKMLQHGPSALTHAELLAIILGTGTRREGVGEIAEKIFPVYSQNVLHNALSPENLAHELHIPLTHACKILAFYELGKRSYEHSDLVYIKNPEDIYHRYSYIERHTKEHLIGIYMDARNRIMHDEIISIGTVNASLISAREILQPAILHHASYIIICHNHPSGDAKPSDEDIVATRKLFNATMLFGIKLLDHVIIGKGEFYSLKQGKYL